MNSLSASSADVASSKSTIGGSLRSTLATASLCRCPPLRLLPFSPHIHRARLEMHKVKHARCFCCRHVPPASSLGGHMPCFRGSCRQRGKCPGTPPMFPRSCAGSMSRRSLPSILMPCRDHRVSSAITVDFHSRSCRKGKAGATSAADQCPEHDRRCARVGKETPEISMSPRSRLCPSPLLYSQGQPLSLPLNP